MSFRFTDNETRGPLRWWYAISAPAEVSREAPLKAREHVRIGKLTSLALCIELIEMGIAGYSATEDPNKLLPFAYLGIVVALLVALVFNRYGKTRVAGILVVVMIEIGMLLTIIGVPHQQLSSFNLPIFALFIQPLLIAASLFPIWLIFPLAIYHITCICLTLTFMQKTPELIEHIQHTPYTAYGIPITLQVVATLVSFIWVRSAYKEMRRAETAEEVNRLTQQLAEHVTATTGQREELERNIEVIRKTLVSVSNGNYQQQVPLAQQDVLWPIALSLNTLLNRMRSFREQALRFAQINSLISELANEIHLHRTGQKNLQIPQTSTGTALDPLAVELRAWLATSNANAIEQQPFPTAPPAPAAKPGRSAAPPSQASPSSRHTRS